MTPDRARGLLLYGLTVVVLAAGATWWVAAAPAHESDAQLAQWRTAVEAALPVVPKQVAADTVVLTTGAGTTEDRPMNGGSFWLRAVCAGSGQVRIRMSSGGVDSGRAVRCSDELRELRLQVSVADQFFMSMEAEVPPEGTAVFRWSLESAVA